MAHGKPDFFVIYNRDPNPEKETDDTKLSLKFTKYLVNFLEVRGHIGLYADRNSKPGSNIFEQLQKNVDATKKTILVVTPEFLRNRWETYSGQYTFKQLLDSQETGKLIPIGIGISDNQKLKELNILDWIHFTKDWAVPVEQNQLKWDVISKVFDEDGPLSSQPAYQEYKHAQEYGDNRLRIDNDALVVKVDGKAEFLTEGFLQRLSEDFPGEWEIFALKLGLRDQKIEEVKRDHSGSVRLQAYYALLSWKKSHPGSEEDKVKHLLSVLNEMGRNDLKCDTEKKFKDFKKSEDSNQGANEGLDEVDMGMSRPRNKVHPVDHDQTSVKPNLMVFGKKQDKGDGEPQHTPLVTREMEAEKTAVIEAKAIPARANTQLHTVKLQQGLSSSLPSPSIKEHSSHCSKPSDDTNGKHQMSGEDSQKIEKGSHGDQTDCKEDIDEPINHEPKNEKHISVTNCQALNVKTSDVGPATQQISNATGNNLENQITDKKYISQQSLSKDDDLSADVNGAFPFIKPTSIADKPALTKPSNLNIDQRGQNEPSLNINSFDAENDTPYSGCYSHAETPLSDQTAKTPQTSKKIEESVDQSEKNKRNQPVESEQSKRNQPVESEENKRDQPLVSAEMRENQTGQEQNSVPQLESIENAIASCQQGVEQADSMQNSPQKPESMNDCNSNNQQVNGELNSTQQSDQGRSPKTTSLVSRVFSAVGGILLRPELAYN